MIIGIDHGYYAIKTKQVCFPTGIIRYEYEPYTMQNVLQYRGEYYVCGTGRQTVGKGQDRQRQLLSFDAGSTGTGDSKAKRGKGQRKLFLQPGFPLPGWEGKNRNSRSICFGRNSLSDFSTKGNAMKSRLRM